ncbi:pimeloyl-ACP methyl ester carboxylesterase [Dyadobacter sp. BE34]|uniref:Pimeloyl-ACP methyl ester carboxylesterase n=1 Tax=Dyadobacter fermentans TaxID=94254 RepID=A0ABU1R560_9BACT|nr:MULTISPECIES: alpha/beta hydrolase [Dyadobacter]MDR6808548.1 pimeloyl-ACP methyl ester carboxylesterase [Dyadobacter fermentans]MDR7046291.1 pimeloyl-ACP methyl ester carboxylesterase [Dyadobacter sp. BE242]MDR7200604.1 pimeloyl-ACP methyl ester carboxylesterase [Dyadobacter sp. BE34]MDR7218564.1 pimeloyl-ACP methyl ester carboxylesterase [Dyadobacter sp. BE31]MDR7266494.1 pimeloyl-ACP methyl ester carboxylesterase [Dyadobacter sp. BE32]
MPVINLPNVRLHVQELNPAGEETLIMVHGMFSNLAVYYFNIAPLLAKHFRVVLFDMKGHGLSEKVQTGYDLTSMTNDLRDLMDVLGIEKAHLAGYSYGGLVALKMATRFPERVGKLAIIEGPDPSEQETLTIIDTYSKEFLIHYIENFADTTRLLAGKRQLEKNHRMYEFLFNETSIRSDMEGEKAFFNDPAVAAIQHETLLIYGEESNCVPSGRTLALRIPNATLVLAPGDHNVPVQQPEVIGKELEKFLEPSPLPVGRNASAPEMPRRPAPVAVG